MPIYEYICNSCGKEIEEYQTLSNKHNPLCLDCGLPMSQLISASAPIRTSKQTQHSLKVPVQWSDGKKVHQYTPKNWKDPG